MFGFSKKIKIKNNIGSPLIYKYKLSRDRLYINKILEIPSDYLGIVFLNKKYIDELNGETKINSVNLPNIFKKISENNNDNKKYFKCNLYLINKNEFEKEVSTYKYIRLGNIKTKLYFKIKLKVDNFIKFFKFYKNYFYGNNEFRFILDLISEDLTYYLDNNNICMEDILNGEKNYQKQINKLTKNVSRFMGVSINLELINYKQKNVKRGKIERKRKAENKNSLVNEKIENDIKTTLVTSPFFKENEKI